MDKEIIFVLLLVLLVAAVIITLNMNLVEHAEAGTLSTKSYIEMKNFCLELQAKSALSDPSLIDDEELTECERYFGDYTSKAECADNCTMYTTNETSAPGENFCRQVLKEIPDGVTFTSNFDLVGAVATWTYCSYVAEEDKTIEYIIFDPIESIEEEELKEFVPEGEKAVPQVDEWYLTFKLWQRRWCYEDFGNNDCGKFDPGKDGGDQDYKDFSDCNSMCHPKDGINPWRVDGDQKKLEPGVYELRLESNGDVGVKWYWKEDIDKVIPPEDYTVNPPSGDNCEKILNGEDVDSFKGIPKEESDRRTYDNNVELTNDMATWIYCMAITEEDDEKVAHIHYNGKKVVDPNMERITGLTGASPDVEEWYVTYKIWERGWCGISGGKIFMNGDCGIFEDENNNYGNQEYKKTNNNWCGENKGSWCDCQDFCGRESDNMIKSWTIRTLTGNPMSRYYEEEKPIESSGDYDIELKNTWMFSPSEGMKYSGMEMNAYLK